MGSAGQRAEPTIAIIAGVEERSGVHGFGLHLSVLKMLQPPLWWCDSAAPLAEAVSAAAESGVPGGIVAR